MPKLISPSGHSLELPPAPYRVGVAPDCEVRLQSGLGIADHHCSVVLEGGEYVLVDCGSGLGTFLNCQRIERERLSHGDRVRFGQIELTYDEQVEDMVPPRISTWRREKAVPGLSSRRGIHQSWFHVKIYYYPLRINQMYAPQRMWDPG